HNSIACPISNRIHWDYTDEVTQMIIMQLNDVSKSLGAEEILKNVKLEIKRNDRIAIVGRNGAGKSTLLRIMAEEISYDEEEIYKPKDLSIGYLSQHTALESAKSIWNEMLGVFDHLRQQEQELRAIERQMENAASLSAENYEKLLQNYDVLQQEFESGDGYNYEAEI